MMTVVKQNIKIILLFCVLQITQAYALLRRHPRLLVLCHHPLLLETRTKPLRAAHAGRTTFAKKKRKITATVERVTTLLWGKAATKPSEGRSKPKKRSAHWHPKTTVFRRKSIFCQRNWPFWRVFSQMLVDHYQKSSDNSWKCCQTKPMCSLQTNLYIVYCKANLSTINPDNYTAHRSYKCSSNSIPRRKSHRYNKWKRTRVLKTSNGSNKTNEKHDTISDPECVECDNLLKHHHRTISKFSPMIKYCDVHALKFGNRTSTFVNHHMTASIFNYLVYFMPVFWTEVIMQNVYLYCILLFIMSSNHVKWIV